MGPVAAASGSIVSWTRLLPRQRTGGCARLGYQRFEIADVVRAGMELEIGKQLALGLGKFFGPREEFDAEARGGRA